MNRELDVDELIQLLRELDNTITTPIVVRAVGGFALAWHGVRVNGLTADIDSITDDYPVEVEDAIAKIGAKHGLGPWWLNNDAAADEPDFIIESMDLKWEPVDCGFVHISLFVGDLVSLLKLKLSAVEDSALSGRTRDLDDTIGILRALGLTKAEFKRKYSYLQDDMPNAFALVSRAIW
ncbi:MAG: hypothetical protein HFJ66_07500 [Eggerthellaceae bacterium]|nr:hypothetical protein [Eggerthellaceae bacterium]